MKTTNCEALVARDDQVIAPCNHLSYFPLAIASGERTRSEEHDYREIAIFKDGVTL